MYDLRFVKFRLFCFLKKNKKISVFFGLQDILNTTMFDIHISENDSANKILVKY